MHSFSNLALTALVVANTAFAIPLNELNTRASTFSVEQISNPNYQQTYASGPLSIAKTYLKYGVTLPANVSNGIAVALLASKGTVKASPQDFDRDYLCPVSIGTPPQVLNMDFDTGSSDLWVFSSETPAGSVNGQKLYKPSKSSSAKLQHGSTWAIHYGDGSSSSGDVYNDVVSIAGIKHTGQAVESAKIVSASFTRNAASSGLVGLAFSSINTVKPHKRLTFFENIEKSLAAPVFAVDLKYHAPGTYDFGFIDSKKHTGSIHYVTTTKQDGYWGVTGSGYAIGSHSFTTRSIPAIVDTGTSLVLLPDDVVIDYYSHVSGAVYSFTYGVYVFPCSTTPPSYTFGIGSYRGTIPGKFLNYAALTTTYCMGGIQSNDGIGFSIFGDVLMKSQFIVFDGGKTRVGFASKKL